MKLCKKCNTEKSLDNFNKNGIGYYSICRECKKIYRQNNKAKLLKSQYDRRNETPEEKNKRRAWNKVYYALRVGKITKSTTCEICNKESDNIQGHHQDYNKPLEITWCCQECHAKLDEIRRCS